MQYSNWRSDYESHPKDNSFVLLRNLKESRQRLAVCRWDSSNPDYPWVTIDECDRYPEDTFNEFCLISQEGF